MTNQDEPPKQEEAVKKQPAENWLLKLCEDIRSKPENHVALIGATISIVVGLCAWQYCRGYFKALGINISYAHIDNLIFAFEQITRISLRKDEHTGFGVSPYVLYLVPVLIVALYLIRGKWDKLKHHFTSRPDDELQNCGDYQYWVSIVSFYGLFVASSYFLSMSVSSYLAKGLILLALFFSFIILIYEIWIKSSHRRFLRPIQWLIYALLPINLFYHLGRFDGARIINLQFRTLDTICLSKPAPEFDSDKKTKGFVTCGKLVYSDSTQLCIKERVATYPACRHKEKYETTIIPNDP